MKKLSVIMVLGLLFSGKAISSELVGKKLECNYNKVIFEYYHFISSDEVQTWYKNKNKKANSHLMYYEEELKFINIFRTKEKNFLDAGSKKINRESLTLFIGELQLICRILDVSDIESYLDELFKKEIETQKKKNKI
jgi:hypothetical protein